MMMPMIRFRHHADADRMIVHIGDRVVFITSLGLGFIGKRNDPWWQANLPNVLLWRIGREP
jgi:hypothetical protein